MVAQPAARREIAIVSKAVLLHLAVDVNTPQRARTTTAIEWFVRELDEFDNVVIGYQRTPRLPVDPPVECAADGFRLFHFPFFGLPLGVGLHMAMRGAARRTIALLEQEGIRPDAVHAHKMTFEGIAGWYVARHFGVPLLLSLRGEVETKVFRRKPLLRPFLRRIARDAARIYLVSAWFRAEFERYVGPMPGKTALLPNIVRNVTPTIAPQPASEGFVCVMNLDTWKRKGLRWLLDGVALARRTEVAIHLDIIGAGSETSRNHVAGMIAERGLNDIVTLVGPVGNAELLERLPRYRALVMPSLNETFGMVYVEALFAGIPILYTRDTAIDGYLDGMNVGRAVAPRDVEGIAESIVDLYRRTDSYRLAIAQSGPRLFETFDPGTTVDAYRAAVRAAITRRGQPQV